MAVAAQVMEQVTPPVKIVEEDVTLKMDAVGVDVFYGDKQALFDVSLGIRQNRVTSLIGPSGCGKSTFLRCLNRMNDVIDICRVTGDITMDGRNIYSADVDVVELRARVGMVFQKPNPFPKSITTMSPMDRAFTVWPAPNPISTRWSSTVLGRRACGTR